MSGVHIETHSLETHSFTQLFPSEATFAVQSDGTAKSVDLHCTVAIVLVKPGF